MPQVRDVMTSDPVTLPSTASTADAAHKMREKNIGAVVVEDEGKICGVVTDRDIVIRAIAEDRDPKTTAIGRICSHQVTTVSPDDDVEEVIQLMRDKAIRRVPVVDGEHTVGILALGDLAIERDRQSVLGNISAAPPNL